MMEENDTRIEVWTTGRTTRRGWRPLAGGKKQGLLTCLRVLTHVRDSSPSYLDLTFDQNWERFIPTEFGRHNL